jgi:hypothetical protein
LAIEGDVIICHVLRSSVERGDDTNPDTRRMPTATAVEKDTIRILVGDKLAQAGLDILTSRPNVQVASARTKSPPSSGNTMACWSGPASR